VFVGLASAIGIALPRRLASSVATRRSRSSSPSLRYVMAVVKSLGRAVLREGRPGRASGWLLDGEPSSLPVKNRSGVCSLSPSRPIMIAAGSANPPCRYHRSPTYFAAVWRSSLIPGQRIRRGEVTPCVLEGIRTFAILVCSCNACREAV
jgi:hypothetical protein